MTYLEKRREARSKAEVLAGELDEFIRANLNTGKVASKTWADFPAYWGGPCVEFYFGDACTEPEPTVMAKMHIGGGTQNLVDYTDIDCPELVKKVDQWITDYYDVWIVNSEIDCLITDQIKYERMFKK
tara:strand:- start:23 stop:406 length:384 start_codon:yes stop_codon:yes gene_type:complete